MISYFFIRANHGASIQNGCHPFFIWSIVQASTTYTCSLMADPLNKKKVFGESKSGLVIGVILLTYRLTECLYAVFGFFQL
jgi:nitric oxide reductase large subunit